MFLQISKEDSVERSIEQAKLGRQQAIEEDVDQNHDNIPMADDSDVPAAEDIITQPERKVKVPENYVKEISKITDSPDLTNSLSTPSSNSRKTYTVPSHYESDPDESSETYTFIHTQPESITSSNPQESQLTSSETNRQASAIESSYEHDQDVKVGPSSNTDTVRQITIEGIDDTIRESMNSSYEITEPLAPKAESEDDYLSNDEEERRKRHHRV